MYIKNVCSILHLVVLIHFSTCRDFYLGMFKKNDLLMSQDTLYKERVPFRYSYAKYGRKYKCPITYVRVVDRLNIGRGPRVEIIRGGLLKKYIVLRLTSPYNNPIAVNIFVGCENKKFTNPPWTIIRPTKATTEKPTVETTESVTNDTNGESTPGYEDSASRESTIEQEDTEDGADETLVAEEDASGLPAAENGASELSAAEDEAAPAAGDA